GISPNSPEGREADKRSRVLIGKKYGEQGDIERALQIFNSVLVDYPNDAPVLVDAGLSNLLLNRLDDAQIQLERAVEIQPNHPMAHKYLGDIYDRKGDLNRAEEHYQKTMQLVPMGSAPARQAQFKLTLIGGLRALNNGQMADAARLFEEALAVEPSNPLVRLNLATAYRGIGKQAEAEQLLRTLLEETPTDLDARLRYGVLLFEEGQLEQAARELEEVIAKGQGGPQSRQATQFLSELYKSAQGKEVQARMLEERIAAQRAVVVQDPDNREAWLNLAVIYLNQRRNPEAIEAFENVIRLDPAHVRVQHTLAELYDEQGDYAKAVPAFTRALELERDDETRRKIQNQLVLTLAKKSFTDGKFDQAKSQFKAIIRDDPNNYVAHFFMALLHARDEQFADAAAEYSEVIRILPGHLGARLNLALVYEQLGREEDALPEYRAVMRAGASGMAETAKKRLESLQKRIDGFTYRVGYVMSWDNNSNLSADDAVEELRSDLSGGATYRHKLRGKRITWGVSYNPAYTIFHNGQYDFAISELVPFVAATWRDYDFSANYTYSRMDGFLNEALVNESSTFYADALKRLKMRPWLPFLAQDLKEVQSALQVNVSYRHFESASSPLFNADSYSLGGLLNQSLANGWSWTGTYSFTDNSNALAIGNDFAYTGHSLSLQLSKFLLPGMSANGGYNYTYSLYKNPDSATRFQESRINHFHSLSTGLNYFINEQLRFFLSYSFQLNQSNLPTGFIFRPEDVSTAVGLQSPSLGSYQKQMLSVGLSVTF
ncbi:MAG: tetratricopeptide repeat protein, partial [Pseudomonadota bacterium]